jgi:hypothetical protein
VEALERLGFTGFLSNKSFLPFVFGAADGTRTRTVFTTEGFSPPHTVTRAANKFAL